MKKAGSSSDSAKADAFHARKSGSEMYFRHQNGKAFAIA